MNRFWPLTRGLKQHWTSFDPQPGFSKNIKESDKNTTYPKPSVRSGKSHEFLEGFQKLELLLSTVLKVKKLGTNDYQQNQKNRPSLVWLLTLLGGTVKLTNYLMMMLKYLVIFEKWTSGEKKLISSLLDGSGWKVNSQFWNTWGNWWSHALQFWSHDSYYYDWPQYRLYLCHITVPHSLLLPCVCLLTLSPVSCSCLSPYFIILVVRLPVVACRLVVFEVGHQLLVADLHFDELHMILYIASSCIIF